MSSVLLSDDVLQYTGIVLATTSLLPQAYYGVKDKSLMDVSATSIIMIGMSACTWGLYMYKLDYIAYASATWFVGLNSLFIVFHKVRLYYQRLDAHMQKFDQPDDDNEDARV